MTKVHNIHVHRGGVGGLGEVAPPPLKEHCLEKDNCLRLQCEVKTNDHWVSFLGYHLDFCNG